MARLAALAAALAASAASAMEYPAEQCDAEYQCVYHVNVGSTEYSWDLRPLCRAPGAEYTVQGSDKSTFFFNICGIVGGQQNGVKGTTYCSPRDVNSGSKVAMYTRGAVVQFPSETNQPTGQCQDVECAYAIKEDPTTNCPVTVPCTNNCEVVAHNVPPTFNLADVAGTNVNGGINLTYAGVPWYPNDFFPCDGQDPVTGLQTERQVTMNLKCNSGFKNTLGNIAVTEVSTCNYLITAETSAACAAKGDGGFLQPNHGPANFGFVCLGAGLTIFCYFFYNFGDSKGWWDGIKAKLPAIPGLSGARGGVFGGGSYKGLSSSTGGTAPSTTPISASAYGST